VAKNIYFKVLPHLLPKNDTRYIKWKKSLKNRIPWNKGKTKDTSSGVRKISETFKKRKIDNFFKWRERARQEGLIPKVDEPLTRNLNLAFLIGITLGDGNIGKMARTECLKITLGTDKPKLWKYTAKVVEMVFNKKPNIHKRKNYNCVDIRIYQKNLSKRLGIPSGARRDKPIKLPKWIWNNETYLKQAVKGLFEAEGSFSIHKKTYTYTLSFSNVNVTLLDEVQMALTCFGFHPERRSNAVRLRKKTETFKFINLIRFRKYPLV
jgi:hypothetical protein